MPQPQIFWRYFTPVLLVILFFIVIGTLLFPKYTQSIAIKDATEQGILMAERLKVLRGYYTEKVINKVVNQQNVQVSFDHLEQQNTIPLPATLIHDLSDIYSKDNMYIKLYSNYPFPFRAERRLDAFELNAWQQLTQNKERVLNTVEYLDDKVFVRTAIADTMSTQACLDCHNSHPDSPKTDWQLDDVRGVLEVRQNISAALKRGNTISYQIAIMLAVVMAVMALIILAVTKKIHAQLIETNALNSQLIDKNEQLATINEQLVNTNEHLVKSERMSLLGSLVAGMSHELNTPIGVCVTAISVLRDKLLSIKEKLLNNKLSKKALTGFIESADEASDITDKNLTRASELLKSFKLVAVEQSTNEQRTIDFHAYLHDVVLSLKPTYKKGKHQVEVISEGDWQLLTYPGSWAQIVTNLITNSVLHGFQDKSNGQITISAKLQGQLMEFNYSDNGVGMNDEVLANLFKPFYTTKRDQGGSGLGMHLVQEIVQVKFNGEITCESTVGAGTTFVIKVPVMQAHGTTVD